MNLIPITEISIAPDRQRRVFDPGEMQELTSSIQEHGLFHALGLRLEPHLTMGTQTPTGESTWVLVHGERRLRAIRDIWELGGGFMHDGELVPTGMIPYTNLGDLNPLERELYELEENLQRADLTLAEDCEAMARIARLRRLQAEEAGLPPPSVSDLAQEVRPELRDIPKGELGKQGEEVRRKILLAPLMKSNPEVRNAKTLKEAWSIAKRQESREKSAALAETVGATFTADLHTLVQADAVEWLADCPDGVFDVILTDPPYGMGADEFGDSGGRTAGGHTYADDENTFFRLVSALVDHSWRITKPQAHLYIFCDIEKFFWLKHQLETAADGPWWVFRTPLVWHKPAAPRAPWPEHGPQRKYETILYAVKGKRPVTGLYPDVITIPPDPNLGHQAQKPVALFSDFLKRSCRPGDRVCDPFAGSGPIIPAAHGLKCIATAVELDPAAYGLCVGRARALRAADSTIDLLEGL